LNFKFVGKIIFVRLNVHTQ